MVLVLVDGLFMVVFVVIIGVIGALFLVEWLVLVIVGL